MYRTIKNLISGRKKVKDEYGTSCDYAGGYHRSLSDFLEILRSEESDRGLVTWRETIGWKPRIIFSWDKPKIFSPQESADYIEERNLLSDNRNRFESRWQTFSDGYQEQHYFDIDIFGYPSGIHNEHFMPEKKLKHKITIDCLLTKK